ncbi:hypothetical protein [Methylobacterium nodulans]|uniref:Uncharacterized protein n=1 Tax=Methylobacterium nodulans (strain LMG 21967 / CNCM I-2342 / ORS 2060) TaxID=460265 RepID=B8IXF9_METNO|nr:hypothetical protein [Methylobacterium nodulans]ACL63200.1 hypothetical protein Mnod_8228 [Methylobacterium nodulans ORS 2060]
MLVQGSAFERQLDFGDIAVSTAKAVMQEASETAQVGVLDGRSVLYVAKADSIRRSYANGAGLTRAGAFPATTGAHIQRALNWVNELVLCNMQTAPA